MLVCLYLLFCLVFFVFFAFFRFFFTDWLLQKIFGKTIRLEISSKTFTNVFILQQDSAKIHFQTKELLVDSGYPFLFHLVLFPKNCVADEGYSINASC